MKKMMIYAGMLVMLAGLMSLNSLMLHVIGTGLLLLIVYMAAPIIYLNYKLRNVREGIDLVQVELMPKSKSDRFKKLFIVGGVAMIFLSVNKPQIFAPMAIIIILLLIGSYLPVVLSGAIWEIDDCSESGENE
ncbi:hypothetical protein [Paenibacillus tepidiphilus]|uniref:hypothetical protein n=1 Tax=Paenibacillus tepidiphilus TaxID=2608683 RepID=UPI00123A9595|nr:hypothetical protein [Paenibacillus tepidiphilus]